MRTTHALRTLLIVLAVALVCADSRAARATTTWEAGFAKVDVTPTEPVRMSGYGSRDHPHEGVDTPLFVRAACLLPIADDDQPVSPLVLLSIDNVGLSGARTRKLATSIESKHRIPRERIVFCNTHTHSAPDLGGQLSNIFAKPLSADETEAAKHYVYPPRRVRASDRARRISVGECEFINSIAVDVSDSMCNRPKPRYVR